MAKPAQRSPLLGYNHNVKYRGRIFHVQTEDSGPSKPRLLTHLYYEGTILASMRLEYDQAAPEDVVRVLMQGQHKAILKELKAAQYDEKIVNMFKARGESLDAPEPADAQVAAAAAKALDLDALPEVVAEVVAEPPPEAATPVVVAEVIPDPLPPQPAPQPRRSS